jgi:hypothetical protein
MRMEANRSSTVLHGLKCICAYAGKSENTLLKYIRAERFPASKIGGEWVSDRDMIDAWRLGRIKRGTSNSRK